METTTRATVQVTLEIPAHCTWGGDSNLEQVYEQATKSAINTLNNELKRTDIKIVGVPKITAITSVRV